MANNQRLELARINWCINHPKLIDPPFIPQLLWQCSLCLELPKIFNVQSDKTCSGMLMEVVRHLLRGDLRSLSAIALKGFLFTQYERIWPIWWNSTNGLCWPMKKIFGLIIWNPSMSETISNSCRSPKSINQQLMGHKRLDGTARCIKPIKRDLEDTVARFEM